MLDADDVEGAASVKVIVFDPHLWRRKVVLSRVVDDEHRVDYADLLRSHLRLHAAAIPNVRVAISHLAPRRGLLTGVVDAGRSLLDCYALLHSPHYGYCPHLSESIRDSYPIGTMLTDP